MKPRVYDDLVQSAVELSCFGTGQSTIEEGRAAYHVRPSTDLDGKTGGECAELIRQALMSIYLQPLHELRSEYNPRDENGELVDWGSVDGAIKWLERVHDYCREHPDYVVRERS